MDIYFHPLASPWGKLLEVQITSCLVCIKTIYVDVDVDTLIQKSLICRIDGYPVYVVVSVSDRATRTT